MAPRMEKVSQIETGRKVGPTLSDISSLLFLAPVSSAHANGKFPNAKQFSDNVHTKKLRKKAFQLRQFVRD